MFDAAVSSDVYKKHHQDSRKHCCIIVVTADSVVLNETNKAPMRISVECVRFIKLLVLKVDGEWRNLCRTTRELLRLMKFLRRN